MNRRSKTSRKPAKARQRKTEALKRGSAPKPLRSSASGQESQVAQFERERDEALEQLSAASEVLKVINSSPGDLKPVFEAILENAVRICDAKFGTLYRYDNETFAPAALYGMSPTYAAFVRQRGSFQPPGGTPFERLLQTKDVVCLADASAEPVPGFPAKFGGARSLVVVPMLKDNVLIGVITIFRQEVRPFADKQIDLVKNFAAQAVIAIENTRLLNELRESLEQQTAMSEVLRVISSSPGELEPVFHAMLENALRICEAKFGMLHRYYGGAFHLVGMVGVPPILARALVDRGAYVPPAGIPLDRLLKTRSVVHTHDQTQEKVLPPSAILGGARSHLSVPMIKEGNIIGAFTIYRTEVRPFTDKQIELVRNFAAQAVIAIENTRLLNELRQRTHDLEEALQFQTASADVLKVISQSPDASQPVFDVIVETSRELCKAQASTIFALRNGRFYVAAFAGVQTELLQHMKDHPIAFDQTGSALARAVREKRTVHIPNTIDDPEFIKGGPISIGGPRATLTVPLMHDGQVFGGITLRQSHRTPFTPRQIEAIETFADQAVIAISNAGLFEQVQQRTRDLSKSLDDLRAAQDRLVQTEKLASLGQLTAGIAHEIKNPLNFVNNFSGLSVELVDELTEGLKAVALDDNRRAEFDELTETLRINLQKVVQHGKRADAIVKNMLLHSRQGSGEHRRVEINALVEESLNLAYHGARAEKQGFEITLERCFDPDAGEADLFPQEITRVLLNLLSNGFYATTKRKVDAGDGFEPMLSATTKNLGDKVEIRIRDNGTGISEGVKEKIFNPFFTTKPSGEGTGLGLSMSHDIVVKQHGGSIDVETEPGLFTEFKIVLPRTIQR